MVIDFHHHLPRDYQAYVDKLREVCREIGIDRVVMCSSGPPQADNDTLARAQEENPDFVISLGYYAWARDTALVDASDPALAHQVSAWMTMSPSSYAPMPRGIVTCRSVSHRHCSAGRCEGLDVRWRACAVHLTDRRNFPDQYSRCQWASLV